MKRLALLEPGTRVDRYVVLDTLGQGGMAVVYRVRHHKLGSLHALKVVGVPSRTVMQRLLEEGKAQAKLHHRNVVQVNDVIEVEGSPGLVMEYVAGPSLEKLLRNVSLDLDTIDRLGRQILRGIAAAHDAGLVHRDLKPANILCGFEEDGLIPKIADFGLVKDLEAGPGATRTGSVMGTPNYMSPEQIRDSKSVDSRTDLFSTGAILYELLTRQLAFPGEDLLDIFNRVAAAQFVPVRSLRADAPDRMVRAVEAALQVKRDDRPATAQALLDLWCGDVPDRALPSFSLPESTIEWIKSATLVPPDHTPVPASRSGQTVSVDDDDEPAAKPPSRSTIERPSGAWGGVFLGAGMLAVGGGLAAVCAGLGGLAAVGWWSSPPATAVDRDTVVAAPVPEVLPVPVPVEPPTPGPTDPAPAVPDPVAPAPVAPVAPRDPHPAPAPPTPVPDAPVPVPVPVPPAPDDGPSVPTTGSVSVTGARAILEGPSGSRGTGPDVPPGHYSVVVDFGNGAGPTKVLEIDVFAGRAVKVSCGLGRCRVSP